MDVLPARPQAADGGDQEGDDRGSHPHRGHARVRLGSAEIAEVYKMLLKSYSSCMSGVDLKHDWPILTSFLNMAITYIRSSSSGPH